MPIWYALTKLLVPPNLDGLMTVRKVARFHDGPSLSALTAVYIRTSEPPWRFEPFHSLVDASRFRLANVAFPWFLPRLV